MQNRKSIVFIINRVGSGGGAERVVQILANYFVKNLHYRITIIGLEKSDLRYKHDNDINFHFLKTGVFNRGIGRIISLPLQSFELSLILMKIKPDVSVSFLVRANLTHIMTKWWRNRKSVFISERNNTVELYKTNNFKDRLMRFLIKKLYKKADYISALSYGVEEALLEYGISKSRVDVISNPVDLESIHEMTYSGVVPEKTSKYRVINIGHLYPQKDQVTLIKAFAEVRKIEDVELFIVGEGPELGRLRKLSREQNVENYIHFLGYQDNPYVLLKSSDLFVLSSRYEGFGNVIVEALACGVPVVSTDCPYGPGEILKNNEYGILVEVGNVEHMKNAILQLIHDNELAAKYAKKGLERVKCYDVSIISKQYLNFFKLNQEVYS